MPKKLQAHQRTTATRRCNRQSAGSWFALTSACNGASCCFRPARYLVSTKELGLLLSFNPLQLFLIFIIRIAKELGSYSALGSTLTYSRPSAANQSVAQASRLA